MFVNWLFDIGVLILVISGFYRWISYGDYEVKRWEVNMRELSTDHKFICYLFFTGLVLVASGLQPFFSDEWWKKSLIAILYLVSLVALREGFKLFPLCPAGFQEKYLKYMLNDKTGLDLKSKSDLVESELKKDFKDDKNEKSEDGKTSYEVRSKNNDNYAIKSGDNVKSKLDLEKKVLDNINNELEEYNQQEKDKGNN